MIQTTASRMAARLARAVAVGLAAMAAVAASVSAIPAAQREGLGTRYLRAVHVLRHISPGEHWPAVAIPRRIRVDDTANALILHQDRAFVLASIVPDLHQALVSGKFPHAGYYAAHALSGLGRHAEAASAMRAYLAEAEYRDQDYLFLVRELYAAGEYPAMRAAAGLWLGQDSGRTCSEDRLIYVWGSYAAEERHREAMETILSDPCASWRGQLLFARSSLALGDEQSAAQRVHAVRERWPDKAREIDMLWNRLEASVKYP